MLFPEGWSIVQNHIPVYFILVDSSFKRHSLENHAKQNDSSIEHVYKVTTIASNWSIVLTLLFLHQLEEDLFDFWSYLPFGANISE